MENIEILSLFSIALFASFGHCIGMCGGIVLAYSSLHGLNLQEIKQSSYKTILYQIISPHLFYHCGKTTTYCILGFIAGGLGHITMPNDTIKYLILLGIGILLIISGIAIGQFIKFAPLTFHFPFSRQIINLMRSLLNKGSKWKLYILGLFNGLLPCGIVYFFLLTAIATRSATDGVLVMGIFGIATIPSLFLLGFISTNTWHKRMLFLRLSAICMIALGCYEIFKAMKYLLK